MTLWDPDHISMLRMLQIDGHYHVWCMAALHGVTTLCSRSITLKQVIILPSDAHWRCINLTLIACTVW
jgi:hypothetical protein